jgi:hypothetical protein
MRGTRRNTVSRDVNVSRSACPASSPNMPMLRVREFFIREVSGGATTQGPGNEMLRLEAEHCQVLPTIGYRISPRSIMNRSREHNPLVLVHLLRANERFANGNTHEDYPHTKRWERACGGRGHEVLEGFPLRLDLVWLRSGVSTRLGVVHAMISACGSLARQRTRGEGKGVCIM